jgi:hypothetical protein
VFSGLFEFIGKDWNFLEKHAVDLEKRRIFATKRQSDA